GQIDQARCLVDGRGLHGCDLVLPKRLAHDVKATRQRRVSKGALPFSGSSRWYDGGERLFGINEFGLGLCQGAGQGGNRLTGSLHGSPPPLKHQSSPRRTLSALPAPHVRSPPWRPRESAP